MMALTKEKQNHLCRVWVELQLKAVKYNAVITLNNIL